MTGYGVERFGYRPFILGILGYQAAITTIFFVAPSIKILLVAECLAGIAFGVFMSGKRVENRSKHYILTVIQSPYPMLARFAPLHFEVT